MMDEALFSTNLKNLESSEPPEIAAHLQLPESISLIR
jgi:hypothetical protein